MKALKHAGVGLAIGFVITTMCMLIFVGFNEITQQLLGWCIASALYGVSSWVFSARLKPIIVSLIHYCICLAITIAMTAIFYWNTGYVWLVVVIFTVWYAVIYISMWLSERSRIKKLNATLSK